MDMDYLINKGVNRPIEFRGLRAQYIAYLAIGLVLLLIGFVILYVAKVPVYVCLAVVLVLGTGLFVAVYRLNHTYGQYGLLKAAAYRQVPSAIVIRSRICFKELYRKRPSEHDDSDDSSGERSDSSVGTED